MRRVMVRYGVKAARNAELVRAVYDELRARRRTSAMRRSRSRTA